MKTNIKLFLLLLLAMAITTQLNAKTFYVNGMQSYQDAIISVNGGSGGDTIQITGDIVLSEHPIIITADVTVRGETNADGSPKYTITCTKDIIPYGIHCQPTNYCTVENMKTDGLSSGIMVWLSSINDRATIKISNCIMTNNSNGIKMMGAGSMGKKPIIEISNCICNNNEFGIFIDYQIENEKPEDLIIRNCITNNNLHTGIDVSTTYAGIFDCVSNENAGGFNLSNTAGVINNCSASRNVQGFSTGDKSTVSNSTATDNTDVGFYSGKASQITNCTAVRSGKNGFISGDLSVVNNCFAKDNGYLAANDYYSVGNGFYLSAGSVISNSTSIGSKNRGFITEGNVINCTAFGNGVGIYGSDLNIFNSIAYNNTTDLFDNYSNKFQVYNSVFKVYSDYNEGSEIHNCSTGNPYLVWMDATGNPTGNLSEATRYVLGDGSSAAGLADRSLIQKGSMIDMIPDYDDPADVAKFISIVTDEYVMNMLRYDQLGNIRSFDGNNYDAGSISGAGGGSAVAKILNYTPQKAANYGQSSILFYGYGYNFDNNTKISLKMQGESDITADACTITESDVSPGLLKCNAEFDFHNKKTGFWDISIALADTTVVIKNGFEIQDYIEPEVAVELIGSDNLRNTRWTNYIVKYENKGNVDIYNVPVVIEIETDADAAVEVKEDWQYMAPEDFDISGISRTDTLIDPFTGRLHTYVAPNVRYIGPYGTGYLSFSVKVQGTLNSEIEISAAALKPMIVVDPNAQDEAQSSALRAGGPCKLLANEDFTACEQSAVDIGIEVGLEIAKALVPGFGCAVSIVSTGCNLVQNYNKMDGLNYAGNAAWDITKTIMTCASSIIPVSNAGRAAWNIVKAMKTADKWIKRTNMGLGLYNNCKNEDKKKTGIIGSADPNDKTGPVSDSGSKWFSDRKEFPYSIDFENKSTATAPAQEIWITDTLDLNVFDITTFEAGFIKIGSRLIEAPYQMQNVTWSVDMPEKNLITTIDLQLDKTKGIATWHFKCVDPKTGEFPTDPSAGFLPPNDDNGSGQGLVMYTIQLKDGLADNVVVANKASIVFDTNDAIVTPEWVNRKDVVPPTSRMIVANNTGNGLAELQWQGTDNPGGSGVYSYDVFMKRNNDDYVMILSGITETTAQVAIDKGADYSFYTIATDNAGNREIKTSVPDVNLGIANVKASVQKALLLYPNPADKNCTVALDMEKAGNVKITVSNLLGATMMKVYDGDVAGGSFKYTFDTRSLPTGIYTVLIYTDRKITGEKLLIERN